DYPLLAFSNLIATPHVAGNTIEVGAHQGQIVVDELRRFFSNEKPYHVLNSEILEGFNWSEERETPDPEILEKLSKSKGPAVSDLEVAAKDKKTRDSGKEDMGSSSQDTLTEADSLVRDHMERIFTLFVEKIKTDGPLKIFSQDKDVIMHFIITDLGLSFFQSYRNGEVRAGVAEPEKSDVVLKMKAEILDGMFTGRVNGMDAAMSGKLSFSGDTAKAMTFQSIQNDMQRLYTEAREEIGDPGDLSNIGKKETDSADGKETEQGVVTGAPAVIKVGDVRDDILMIVNELFSRGLITGTGGNVSARVDGKDDEIWISPGQIFKGDLRADMMVKIDLNGDPLDPDGLSASKERSMHTAIYRKRPDLRAVIHSHAPMAGILDMTDTPFLPISTDAAFFGEIARVPFFMPGSQDLVDAVADAIGTGYAVMMKNHGLIVAASSLRMAADFTDMIEVSSEALLECRNLGVEPSLLPDDIAKNLKLG
ncbi:MAG: hypothetical protein GY864_12170, partial [Desulfobacterales bacterium]|nr:hypothetical protein [Desulfobacterales bacterium]